MLIDKALGVIPVEIKASSTYNQDFLKGIDYWKKIQPDNKQSFLIYTGENSFKQNDTQILNWKALDEMKIL